MITASAIIAFLSKYGSDLLDFLKKHWRITIESAAAVWIIVCCLDHCGSSRTTPIHPEAIQPITIIAPSIPIPTVIDEPIPERVWSLASIPEPTVPTGNEKNDSIEYLLEVTDWLQNRLYLCDSAYTDDTAPREYADAFETDSAKVNYSITVSGRLKEPPRFAFTPKWKQPVSIERPRGIYLEGSIGPVMGYSDPIQLLAIRGEVGIGLFNRKGWSYGVKAGASQLGWDVQASFRRNFSINLSTKSR